MAHNRSILRFSTRFSTLNHKKCLKAFPDHLQHLLTAAVSMDLNIQQTIVLKIEIVLRT